jgi:site-specific recombinase XerD
MSHSRHRMALCDWRRTRKIYHDRAVSLDAWPDQLSVTGASEELTTPREPGEVTPRHIEAYIDAVVARTSRATASHHYRALQQFLKYLVLEEAISSDPFEELVPPKRVTSTSTTTHRSSSPCDRLQAR